VIFLEILKVALESLWANPMRSILTMLGIIIGVAAVVVMVALGTGAQAAVEERITSLGTNLLSVRSAWGRGRSGARMRSERLNLDDARALQATADSVSAVVPVYENDAQIEYLNRNMSVDVVGTWDNWAEVRDKELAQGRFFSAGEAEGRRRVAVLGHQIAEELFGPGEDPVGAEVYLRGVRFESIGVLAEQGAGMGWDNPDEQVIVPISTSQWRLFGTDRVEEITLQVADEDLMMTAMVEVESVMRQRHKILPDQENDFRIYSQTQFLEILQETQQTFTLLLAGIAAVSLLVGGIGIMNIMLVSVTERTREIGIRKAVGAKRAAVQLQFLIEAIVLSCAGGVIGIGVAILASDLLASRFGWEMLVSAEAVVLSFGFAAAIGIVFGFYPAVRASRLDPIDALRYE